MLDLDSLAQARAKLVNEEESTWRAAVWSSDFQKLSQNMSDGEVETLVGICPTVSHFQNVVRFMAQKSQEMGVSPFTVLQQESQRAGLQMGEWIKSQMVTS